MKLENYEVYEVTGGYYFEHKHDDEHTFSIYAEQSFCCYTGLIMDVIINDYDLIFELTPYYKVIIKYFEKINYNCNVKFEL